MGYAEWKIGGKWFISSTPADNDIPVYSAALDRVIWTTVPGPIGDMTKAEYAPSAVLGYVDHALDSDALGGTAAAGYALVTHAPTHVLGGADHVDALSMGARDLHGFPLDANQQHYVTLSYDAVARQVTITPLGASFDYYVKGNKFNHVGAETSAAHAAVTATYYFSYDSAGVLQVSTTYWLLQEATPVCVVYYNATLVDGIAWFELHGWRRDPALHSFLHATYGTQVHSGFLLSGVTLDSDVDANKRPAFTSGVVMDEDIYYPISALLAGNYTILSRTGAAGDWTWVEGNVDPYLVGASYIRYNQFTGGAWQLTELTSGQFVNYYVFVMTALDVPHRIIVVPGQTVHATQSAAEAETVSGIQWGTPLPFPEIAPVYQITFRGHSSYMSTGKCVIRLYARLITSKAQLTASIQIPPPGISVIGTYTPVTVVSTSGAGYTGALVWRLVLPQKSYWDFVNYDYKLVVNAFKNAGAANGSCQLYWYNGGGWSALPSSEITTISVTHQQFYSGVLDLTAVTDAATVVWALDLKSDGANALNLHAAAVIGFPK